MQFRKFVLAAAAVAAGLLVNPASASPGLPFGAGAWTAADNVTLTGQCTVKGTTTSGSCDITADSTKKNGDETCKNENIVIDQPVIVGTNPKCRVSFTATLLAATTHDNTNKCVDDPTTEQQDELACQAIDYGACAGFRLSGAEIHVYDDVLQNVDMVAHVSVHPGFWDVTGEISQVYLNGYSYVMHVHGVVTPGCVFAKGTTKLPKGTLQVDFTGSWAGNYTVA